MIHIHNMKTNLHWAAKISTNAVGLYMKEILQLSASAF
jgi:hypothetical protein